MSRKALLYAAMALVLCFGVVLATDAAQPIAKDLVLTSIKNFDMGIDKGFYEKSQDETNIQITEFDGSLTKDLDYVKGASINFLSQLDASNNAIKISYATEIKGSQYSGDIYLKDDKVIFTKDIFSLLEEFGLDLSKDNPALLEQSPDYLYLSEKQLKSVWEQMTSYQNQQLPEEYKELLLFLVEAIPDQYFSVSATKVALKLDQDGLENVLYNLLTKVRDEKERAADIIVQLNRYSFEQMGMTPDQMKEELISAIDTMPVISREQIKLVGSFVEVKDISYEAALLPGGQRNFNMDLGFKAPDGSAGGFAFGVDSVGTKDNLEGSYSASGGFNALEGPQFDFSFDCLYRYEGEVAYSDTTVKAAAKDNSTGESLLNFGATANSISKVDQELVVNVPELDAANSADILLLYPELEQILAPPTAVEEHGNVGVEPPLEEPGLKIVVNENALETAVNPSIKDNEQIMVPARAVLEALGCTVKWVDPNEVHITAGDNIILVVINESSYTANGLEKALSVPAYLEAGYTMIPASFIIEELGAGIELVEGAVIITK